KTTTDRAYYKSIVRRQISDLVQSHESVQFGTDQHDSTWQTLDDITMLVGQVVAECWRLS
ncbi:MAG: hypothetical protein WCK66_05890, partial [Betaproteobacteria bacterium]